MKNLPIRYIVFSSCLCIVLYCAGAVQWVHSKEALRPLPMAQAVEEKFRTIVQQLNTSLSRNQTEYHQSNLKLAEFVDRSLLPIWSTAKTLAGLLGNQTWTGFSQSEQGRLIAGFNNTIQRYVQEGFSKYQGQQIVFQGIRLSKNQRRGYLTVKIVPEILPEFNIDFKIALIEGNWYLYDAGLQGISYIDLKKDSFRQQLSTTGVDGVLSALDEKNVGYLPSRYSK